MLSPEEADSVAQETLVRVISGFRGQEAFPHPERFGAFVNSVCNNLLPEFYGGHGSFSGTRPRTATAELSNVPGYRVQLIAKFLCKSATMREIVEPILADMQFEYFELCGRNTRYRVALARVRCYWSLLNALGLHRIMKLAAQILSRTSK